MAEENKQKSIGWRKVDCTIWQQMLTLKARDKLVYLYLKTSDSSHNSGLYYIPTNTISFETGLDNDDVIMALERLNTEGLIVYDFAFSMVYMPGMLYYTYGVDRLNDKQQKGLESYLKKYQHNTAIEFFLEEIESTNTIEYTPMSTRIDRVKVKPATGIDTPMDTCTDTPIDTPVDTPIDTRIDTPVDTRMDTRTGTCMDTCINEQDIYGEEGPPF